MAGSLSRMSGTPSNGSPAVPSQTKRTRPSGCCQNATRWPSEVTASGMHPDGTLKSSSVRKSGVASGPLACIEPMPISLTIPGRSGACAAGRVWAHGGRKDRWASAPNRLEWHVPVGVEDREAPSLLLAMAILVREQPLDDLSL